MSFFFMIFNCIEPLLVPIILIGFPVAMIIMFCKLFGWWGD